MRSEFGAGFFCRVFDVGLVDMLSLRFWLISCSSFAQSPALSLLALPLSLASFLPLWCPFCPSSAKNREEIRGGAGLRYAGGQNSVGWYLLMEASIAIPVRRSDRLLTSDCCSASSTTDCDQHFCHYLRTPPGIAQRWQCQQFCHERAPPGSSTNSTSNSTSIQTLLPSRHDTTSKLSSTESQL